MSISTDKIVVKLEQALQGFKQAVSLQEKTKQMSKIQVLTELWLESDQQTHQNDKASIVRPSEKQIFPTPLSQASTKADLENDNNDGTSIFDF